MHLLELTSCGSTENKTEEGESIKRVRPVSALVVRVTVFSIVKKNERTRKKTRMKGPSDKKVAMEFVNFIFISFL